MTYIISELTDHSEKQVLVTTDRKMVDKIVSEWVEDWSEESPGAPASPDITAVKV